MKAITTLFLSLALMALLFQSCTPEGLTPNEVTEELLRSQIWDLVECKIDGVVTSKYDGLTLQFGTGIYSTTNGGSLWPASGTWKFQNNSGKNVVRDDGLEVEIIKVSADELKISFYWDTTVFDGGRAKSIKGNHEMTFRRRP